MIRQGEVYWADLGEPSGSEPALRHPCVIVQNDLFNRSNIGTVIACSVTSNLRRADAPGNVLISARESGLRKDSIVNVSQVFTLDKRDLAKKIGTLPPERLAEILAGIALLIEPRDIE